MLITDSGNVGIGTNNPGAKLEVSGSIKLSETAATTDTDKFVVLDSGVLKYRTGSQVRSDIGAGIGNITGITAGTYLTGGGNNGNVTVNADSTQLAHIHDSSNGTVTAGWITVAQASGARKAGEIYVTDGESSDHSYIRIEWMRSYADSNFTVLNCGGHANRIVGVRVLEETADKTYGKKYIQVKVTTSSNYYVIVTAPGEIPNYGDFIAETPVLENTKTGYNVKGSELENLQDSSIGTDQGITVGGSLFVDDNVGIGTTLPGTKLHVAGGIITVNDGNGTTYYEGVKINSYDTNGYDIIGREGLTLSTASAGKHIIMSPTGNVGIGTTSPSVELDVNGTSKVDTGITEGIHYVGTALEHWGDGGTGLSFPYNDALTLKTASSDRLHINSNGNVGIGTTSPSYKLDVNGTLHSSNITLADGIYHEGDTNTYINFLSDQIQMATAGSVRAYINSSGNVGIGTTSPNAKLNINGSVKIESTNPLYFGGTTSVPNWEIKAYGSGGNDLLINDTGTNSGDLIFTGQDFGVGTTNPLEKLHVSGEPHPSIRLSSSSDSNYNVVINCGYRNEALNLSVGGYKVFTTEGYNTPETTHLYSNNSKALSLASNQAATFTSTVTATNFINSSDERLKENIEKVCNNSLDVQWKTFEFKSDRGQKRYGVIAQELEKTNPEFVREDTEGFKSVAYIDLLIAKIAELEERIQTLENK